MLEFQLRNFNTFATEVRLKGGKFYYEVDIVKQESVMQLVRQAT
jgi:hypothetical protein